jgi:hypothetical protein
MLAHVSEFRRYVTNPIAQASSPPTPSTSSGQALAKNARMGHPPWGMVQCKDGPHAYFMIPVIAAMPIGTSIHPRILCKCA